MAESNINAAKMNGADVNAADMGSQDMNAADMNVADVNVPDINATDMDAPRTFSIHTLGCKVNTYESDLMAEALKKKGFKELQFGDAADICIINTCTVTNIADRKSRQLLRRAKRFNPDTIVVAAGCYADDAASKGELDELIKDGVIDVAVSNKDKHRAAQLIEAYLDGAGNRPDQCGGHTGPKAESGIYRGGEARADSSAAGSDRHTHSQAVWPSPGHQLSELDGHTRAFIKVQDGCNRFCSYCVIPYVRGRVRIRPIEESLREIKLLAANDVAEVVLTGIDISSMGDGLISLIEGIQDINGIRRVRLGSIEPEYVTEERVKKLRSYDKLCPHFHLSLQSGSDSVLKRMNRHYTVEDYKEKCGILREYYEHPAITTDIIVGFPGETEAEFEETCTLAQEIGFYEAHVFPYSRRKGTPADRMSGQLTAAEKSLRLDRLTEITNRLSTTFREYYIGRELTFLTEETVELFGEKYLTGYTSEYVRCIMKLDSGGTAHNDSAQSGTVHSDFTYNELKSGNALQIIQEKDIDESILLV